MAIDVVELVDSRKISKGVGASSMLNLHLRTRGSENEELVALAVEEWLDPYVTLNGVRYRFNSYEMHHEGGGVYEVVAKYEGRPPIQISIDSTGASQRITQSLETVKRYGVLLNSSGEVIGQMAEEDVPDFKGAIGFDGEKVEGCDVILPTLSVTETFRLDPEEVDESYITTIRDLTGSVNDVPFRFWQKGEVLFLGGRASQRGTEQWEFQYSYSVQANSTSIYVGEIGPIEKEGWDYLWIRYQDSADKNSSVKRPRYAYVEQVYPRNDFALLYPDGISFAGLGYGVPEGGGGEGEEGEEGGGGGEV